MKKVMLSAAALMIGAVSFGQVTQSGQTAGDADRVANQSGDATANTGNSVQTGTGQEVSVTQIGTLNSVLTNQGDGTGLGDNKIRVQQAGPNALGVSWAFLNEAEANQLGTDNQATITQESGANDALVEQGLRTAGSANNRALVEQGFDGDQFFETENFAYVQQDGSGHSAYTKQTNDNNDAWVDQRGINNRVSVEQHSTPSDSELENGVNRGNSSYVLQHGQNASPAGDRNEARVDQSTDGARNVAELRQFGRENRASQTQVNPSQRTGDDNLATISQGLNSWPDRAAWSEAHQTQEGARNEAAIVQNDGQWGERTYGEQIQEGNDNFASMDQQGKTDNGPDGRYTYGKQEQIGDGNSATLTQDGIEGSFQNMAYQLQEGDLNVVTSSQYGENNKLNTLQFGDASYAMTSQTGSYNAALVVQHDGQSYSLTQTGVGNQANIFQANAFGEYSAEECSFDPQIQWEPVPVVPSFDPADVCVDCN